MDDLKLEKFFLRWQQGMLSTQETAWLEDQKAIPEFRKQWSALQKSWKQAGEPVITTSSPAEAQWQRLASRIENGNVRDVHAKLKQKSWHRWFEQSVQRPVFALVAAVLIFFAVWQVYQLLVPKYQIIATAPAERLTYHLPDGSTMELNCASNAQFPDDFNASERCIVLHGEAFFQVQKSTKPFIVNTEDAVIRVTGTEFNVRTFEGKTQIAVQSGSVAFSALQGKSSLQLTEKDAAIIQGNQPQKIAGTGYDYGAWRRGELVFNDRELQSVAAELSRRFAAIVQVKDSLQGMRISAHFKNESLQEMLAFIAQATGTSVKMVGGDYWIR
ncbi:MAG: FecR domain-containing protein [Deferribacteres bacterium]|nr:FecR domain-containing protein [Deferribacteres bacterium]